MSIAAPEHAWSDTGEPPEWWLQCRSVHSTDVIYIDMPVSMEYRCHDCDRAVIYRRRYQRPKEQP